MMRQTDWYAFWHFLWRQLWFLGSAAPPRRPQILHFVHGNWLFSWDNTCFVVFWGYRSFLRILLWLNRFCSQAKQKLLLCRSLLRHNWASSYHWKRKSRANCAAWLPPWTGPPSLWAWQWYLSLCQAFHLPSCSSMWPNASNGASEPFLRMPKPSLGSSTEANKVGFSTLFWNKRQRQSSLCYWNCCLFFQRLGVDGGQAGIQTWLGFDEAKGFHQQGENVHIFWALIVEGPLQLAMTILFKCLGFRPFE